LLKRAGYAEVDLHLLAAHNHVVGDGAFLKAEGAGIPMQLVKAGHLASEALDRIAGQWRTTVTSKDHAIFRMLFAAVGEKPSERDNVSRGSGNLGQDMCVSPTAPGFGRAGPQSHAEIQGFIRETLAVEMSVPVQSLGTDDSLIHLGVDSMAAVGLCNHLESRLGVMLSMAEVLSAKSIGELADKVVLLVNRSNSSAGH
jgi:acyl carrier protein